MHYRRSLSFLVILVAVVGLVAIGGPVGEATADHGEPYEDTDLIEVHTISADDAPDGKVEIEISYHVGDTFDILQTTLLASNVEVVDVDGFTQESDSTYAWDQTSDSPTIVTHVDANRSVERSRFGGNDYVWTGSWGIQSILRTQVQWIAPPDATREVYIETKESPSYTSETMMYAGEYEQTDFTSSRETFTIIDSDAADPNWSTQEIRSVLTASSNMFDGGGDSSKATLYTVSDPLRLGGLTPGGGADFWVHEESLKPGKTILHHEYIHTRQTDRRAKTARWTYEGEPTFYEYLLGLKQGTIDYHEFFESLTGADSEYSDVVLAEPGTWSGTTADYDLGGLAIASLDAEIRSASGGTSSYEDVMRAKNGNGEKIDGSQLEALASDAAGKNLKSFFENNVRSTPSSLDIPSPRMYETSMEGSSLDISLSETSLAPGGETALQFEITNSGTADSIAPALSVDLPPELETGSWNVRAQQGVDSQVTTVDDLLVFDNLPPGETVVVDYGVVAPADATLESHEISARVTDMGGEAITRSSTIDVTVTPDAVVSAPDGLPITETAQFDGRESSDEEGITSYTWELSGPEYLEFETSSSTFEHDFTEPGEYTLTLTVENQRGATDSVERTVIVSDQPTISIDAPDQVTPGGEAIFNSTVTNEIGSYDVTWQVDDQEYSSTNLRYTFNNTGEREITATAEDEYGAKASETITVKVGGGGDVNGETNDNPIEDAGGPGMGLGTAMAGLAGILSVLVGRALLASTD